MQAIDHDRLFKELLTTFFADFLALLLPEVAIYLDADSVRFLDKELFTDVTEGESHEADLVAHCRFRGEEACFLIHVENQATQQQRFPKRMFKYFARLHEKHDLPVYPVAVLSWDAPRSPAPDDYRVVFPDREVLCFRYHTIQLNRLNWRDYLNSANPVASALMAKMAIDPVDRPKVKLECLRLLVTLKLDSARMKLISGFIDTYLRLNREELALYQRLEATELTPQQQERVMQITTSWMEQGIQQGLQQGMQQGLEKGVVQGEAELLRRQLKRRFGIIPDAIEQRLSMATREQLERWADNILDAKQLHEVFEDN